MKKLTVTNELNFTVLKKAKSLSLIRLQGILSVMSVFAMVSAIADSAKKAPYIIFVLCCALFFFRLINTLKEKKNAPRDSKTMIEELEKRVDAVNLWDK